ncbi:MAG: DUF1501 domain-containing protein [Verrucomicrobiales bacterium]
MKSRHPAIRSAHPRCAGTRREFLWQAGAGFAGVALSGLLQGDGSARAAAPQSALAPKPPKLPGKVKSCIFLFMYGGPSQMDLFDYKPELQKNDGKTAMEKGSQKKLLGSKRQWAQHGKSGLWVSDALPHLAKHADKLAVIKSLFADSPFHGAAMIQMNSGRIIQGSPSIGSWIDYGLGTLNQNLPGYVVMLDQRGGPISGEANWSSGFMPATYQGTVLRSTGQAVLDLDSSSDYPADMQRDLISTANDFNSAHLAAHPGYSELQARIASYELAFQLQRSAPEALDLSQETEATREMYGLNDPKTNHPLALGPAPFGRQCLIARRLVERGVRFIQIYHGGGHQQQNWDAHEGVEENLAIHCPEIDKPISALLADLEQRGLLEETFVVWGGEFGRTASGEGEKFGRDHNAKGFTYFLAGGGVKGGTSYGATDELGMVAVEKRHHIRDLHATILHQMGLDPNHLTYLHGGLDQKLVGVTGADPITGILA